MGSEYYGKMWITTCDRLKDIAEQEEATRVLGEITDRQKAKAAFASIYIKYVFVVNALGDIYDQTLQVQKRAVVKTILTVATKRMLELQTDLKKIEMSEYMYFDHTLIEQKLIPTEVQLLTPFYYPMERPEHIEDLLNGVRHTDKPKEDPGVINATQRKTLRQLKEASQNLSPEERRKLDERKALIKAVDVIISHEKARQSRNLLLNLKVHPKLYVQKPYPEVDTGPKYTFTFKEDQVPLFPVKRTDYGTNFYKGKRKPVGTLTTLDLIDMLLSDISRNEAASVIQRCYLRFKLKKAIRKSHLQHQHDLGMLELTRADHTSEYEQIKAAREKRRRRKREFDKAFIRACEDDKARILRLRTPYIMEDISDHIRYWFREMYDAAGEFQAYPPEVSGGSIMIIRGETKTAAEFAEFIAKRKKMSPEKIKKELEKEKKDKAAKKKKERNEKRKAKKLLKQQKKEWAKQTNRWTFDDGRFITENALKIDSEFKTYAKEWKFIDELNNLKELPYMDWITETNYADVHQALRLEVDKLMRLEMELLRKALCKDRKIKYKAPKAPRKKSKKGKKGKKKGKKAIHMKIEKLEKLYDKFVSKNVIIPCPNINMDDFIGDLNYAAYDLRKNELTPSHSLGEVKYLLRQWTFGLGDISVPKVRSICIAGPPGCGKKLLANGLIRELGAVLFNISPDVVVQFQDKIKKFVDDLTKLSKILAPSVLFINNAHYPFLKKVTPEIEDQQPLLLGKHLPKLKKGIKKNEKVLLIGTTNQPFSAKPGPFRKTFEKVAVCYGPDYSSTLLAWQKVLPPMGVDPEFDYSTLAKMTKYYQMSQILSAPKKVLNLERRAHLQQRPLEPIEMLQYLMYGDPPQFPMTEKELAKFVKFNQKFNKFKKKPAPQKKK
ncbi:hypothetical protein HA402_001233 [Bradysia odoriphaga]|nr:hypothetical protein HA402_001233 [Bradysia odoriphaga]